MNRLIVIGAGGHGKVIADIALKNGYSDIYFVDDYVTDTVMGFDVLGKTDCIETLIDGKTDFVIGIGNNEIRKRIAAKYELSPVTLVHPSAQIASNVFIGKGTVIMAQAVVNSGSEIGLHSIINTGAVVEHDNSIGDYVHISPRVALGGTVRVENLTHIGIGATVKNNITICSECVVGAGAVVVNNIEVAGTYIGVPAKMAKF